MGIRPSFAALTPPRDDETSADDA